MTENPEAFHYIEEDGTLYLFDAIQAQKDIAYLAGLMIVVTPEERVSTELMRIHAESGSFAYTREIAIGAVTLCAEYMLETMELFTLEFSLQHLKSMIYAYRTVRPVTGETDGI